jgi:hypothetical protein
MASRLELNREERWVLFELNKHPNAVQSLAKILADGKFKFAQSSIDLIFNTLYQEGFIEGSPDRAFITVKARRYIKDNNFYFVEFQESIPKKDPNISVYDYPLPRHILTVTREASLIVSNRYKYQGLIGYTKIAQNQKEEIEIVSRFLYDWNEFICFLNTGPYEQGEGNLFESTTLGFASRVEFEDSIELRNFHSEEAFNDLLCTNPDIDRIYELGYEEQYIDKNTLPAYISRIPREGYSPLYVWSTQPDLILFTPLQEDPTQKTGKETDKSAILRSDDASKKDELGREKLVRVISSKIDDLFKDYDDSYTILLNGEWGSGKSSMLNFFEDYLKEKNWKVIRYNAWENQQFKDPWWILINAISKKATDENYEGDFTSHRRWKLGIQYDNKLWAFLVIAVFVGSIFYLFNTSGQFTVSTISGIVALITSIVSAIVGLTNNFFFKNVTNEDLKERFTEHPFNPIRQRFNEIVENNKLAIFIDDLDRCNVDATVNLLEGIQNLFKSMPVLYIIAADGRWVSNCFTQKYASFENLTNDSCSIGDKFLQKTFQLTLNVPKPHKKYLQLFWDNLIDQREINKSIPQDSVNENNELESSKVEKPMSFEEEVTQLDDEIDRKLEEENVVFQENVEKYLRKFYDHNEGETPRQMKRFINQYEVARQMMIIEGNEQLQEEDSMVHFLIFTMRYPSLADKLKKGEIRIEDIASNSTLTQKDKKDIQELLNGIDEEIIKGTYYSI